MDKQTNQNSTDRAKIRLCSIVANGNAIGKK